VVYIFRGHLVYFSRLGTLYKEKSGNLGSKWPKLCFWCRLSRVKGDQIGHIFISCTIVDFGQFLNTEDQIFLPVFSR
jgi:hypothetical protein